MTDARLTELRTKITLAAGVAAVEKHRFYRANLARAMRRALAAGLPRNEVIALSAMPRDEAESLICSG